MVICPECKEPMQTKYNFDKRAPLEFVCRRWNCENYHCRPRPEDLEAFRELEEKEIKEAKESSISVSPVCRANQLHDSGCSLCASGKTSLHLDHSLSWLCTLKDLKCIGRLHNVLAKWSSKLTKTASSPTAVNPYGTSSSGWGPSPGGGGGTAGPCGGGAESTGGGSAKTTGSGDAKTTGGGGTEATGGVDDPESLVYGDSEGPVCSDKDGSEG